MIKIKIILDLEFSGLHKHTTAISIGLISEVGDTFYAEFTDYNKSQCGEWIEDNVIANLSKNDEELKQMADITVKGSSVDVRQELLNWLSRWDTVEWVADVCHYDFVLLIDLLYGSALNIPSNIAAVCHDINQDIARHFDISDIEAFDKSREEIASFQDCDFKIKMIKAKHNSLYDAYICYLIYTMINF